MLTSLEICAGGGGQAVGLEQAGFEHVALVDNDHHSCLTLRFNRPKWNVREEELKDFEKVASMYYGVDLLSGGVPCPPFSKAGRQLGEGDERNLFPIALRLVDICRPRAVLFENVRGLYDPVFNGYRQHITDQLTKMGYKPDWHLFNASDFGVSQLRPRVAVVAIRRDVPHAFSWPTSAEKAPLTVGELLYEQMASQGWLGAARWREQASRIAPTIVGGSKKHGGPDLGPTRAKSAWASLGVDGHNIAENPPGRDFIGMPRLTVPMVALIQGFPPDWVFCGRKTHAYRQVGNAFPPPVARAIGEKIFECLTVRRSVQVA